MKKPTWNVPISGEAFTVANLMSVGLGIKQYIDIAVCTMAIEQLDRLSKEGKSVPPNIIRAVDVLHKKVKKCCGE
jgi:hypothetical protein